MWAMGILSPFEGDAACTTQGMAASAPPRPASPGQDQALTVPCRLSEDVMPATGPAHGACWRSATAAATAQHAVSLPDTAPPHSPPWQGSGTAVTWQHGAPGCPTRSVAPFLPPLRPPAQVPPRSTGVRRRRRQLQPIENIYCENTRLEEESVKPLETVYCYSTPQRSHTTPGASSQGDTVQSVWYRD